MQLSEAMLAKLCSFAKEPSSADLDEDCPDAYDYGWAAGHTDGRKFLAQEILHDLGIEP